MFYSHLLFQNTGHLLNDDYTYFTDERILLYRTCSIMIPEIQNMNNENILTECYHQQTQ